jgi:hypothetical protein
MFNSESWVWWFLAAQGVSLLILAGLNLWGEKVRRDTKALLEELNNLACGDCEGCDEDVDALPDESCNCRCRGGCR